MDTFDTQQIEYGRFADLERRFGIRRSTAYALLAAGKIRSACVKKKNARSGVRLIDLPESGILAFRRAAHFAVAPGIFVS